MTPTVETTIAADVDPLLLLSKQRELRLKRDRLAALKSDRASFYRPHPKQDAFHRAGDRFRRRFVRSGNRFGKSEMGAAEDCAWLRNERAWYAEDDPARRSGLPQRPVKGLLICADWDKSDEIFTSHKGYGGKLWNFLPPGFAKVGHRNSSGAADRIDCANGSSLYIDTVRSYMSNPLGSESSDWDFVHVDEPCPEGMWKAVSRGLIDRLGSAWFTLTPISEAWINDMFTSFDTQSVRDGMFMVEGAIYDNPYITAEAIEEYAASLTDDEKQCRLFGLPLAMAGLVYKQFSYAKHVLQEPPKGWASLAEPPECYSLYVAIDPHPHTPHAVLFCAVSPQGHRFYYDEIFEHCSIAELSALIHVKVGSRKVQLVLCDPLAFIDDPVAEITMAEAFWRRGIMVEKAVKALSAGLIKVQSQLKLDPAALYFSPLIRRTLWEITRYCWSAKENKPVDRDDHMMENLYRLEWMEPRWIDSNVVNIPIPDITIDSTDLDLTI